MSEESGSRKDEAEAAQEAEATPADADEASPDERPAQSGPAFEEAPDPLAGARRVAGSVWNSMDGKTVSMRTYVGSIIGVIVLMMLARCGG